MSQVEVWIDEHGGQPELSIGVGAAKGRVELEVEGQLVTLGAMEAETLAGALETAAAVVKRNPEPRREESRESSKADGKQRREGRRERKG